VLSFYADATCQLLLHNKPRREWEDIRWRSASVLRRRVRKKPSTCNRGHNTFSTSTVRPEFRQRVSNSSNNRRRVEEMGARETNDLTFGNVALRISKLIKRGKTDSRIIEWHDSPTRDKGARASYSPFHRLVAHQPSKVRFENCTDPTVLSLIEVSYLHSSSKGKRGHSQSP
jgi:hypothetical protein